MFLKLLKVILHRHIVFVFLIFRGTSFDVFIIPEYYYIRFNGRKFEFCCRYDFFFSPLSSVKADLH